MSNVLWVDPDDDPRNTGVETRGERAVVLHYLQHFRTTFQMKCDGLDADQMARRSVPPSSMSLLGLLRHLGAVEQRWFRCVVEGNLDLPRLWGKDDDLHADFDNAEADPAMVVEAWEVWKAEVAHAQLLIEQTDFDHLVTLPDDSQIEVREVLVHLVEEYARHCGHADLLREAIDGRVGA